MREGQSLSSQSEKTRNIGQEALFLNALDSTHWDKFDGEYVEALAAGGIDAVNVTIPGTEDNFRQAIASYQRWHRMFEKLKDKIELVQTVSDIKRAKELGKVAMIRGFQNSKAVEDDLDLLDVFYRLGIRIMQLTYNRRNYVGDGCAEDRAGGLSRFGVSFVKRLNELNYVIDLSHASFETAMHALEISESPPVMTHTNMKALCNHFRCVPDELVKAIAERGGVIGITALSIFLRNDGLQKGSQLDDCLNHLEHAISIAGIDHVGVGFDVGFKRTDEDTADLTGLYPEFKFPPLHLRYCEQLNRADKAGNLITGMLSRGFSKADTKKILGENFLRVFEKAWGN